MLLPDHDNEIKRQELARTGKSSLASKIKEQLH